MNLKPPDWVAELEASLQREWGDGPRIASLATVDVKGMPQVRSVVIRELAGDGSIWFVTDSRSPKVEQLSNHPRVQLLIWLPTQRVQYRLTGEANRIVEHHLLQSHWEKLSEATKEMFFWGCGDSDSIEVPPSNFAVYRVITHRTEYLSIASIPHQRWIASEPDGWQRHTIAP